MDPLGYKLTCPACGFLFDDDGFILTCPRAHSPALLTTRYSSRTLEFDEKAAGIYRYQCWLPGVNRLAHAGRSVTYQSRQLSSILNLPNLWITFSGYWPECGAALETATFKELEVAGVLSRIPASGYRALVVASAGNTAAAFARACSENEIPCLIIVPAYGMKRMRFANSLHRSVKIVCLTGGAGYSDAIALAKRIFEEDGFVDEGGVKNIGRRDGMATAMLNAVETIGRLPDYYFQAIASGAGAIAAHEGAKRLVGDSRFGCTLPRLMLSQNRPFTPIHDAWKRGRRDMDEINTDAARALTERIVASVLSNHRPPYSIHGGMFDVLSESRGEMFAVENEEALKAMRLFEKCEGIDIDPTAGVALAALMRAASTGQIDSAGTVLLHVTGGGARKRVSERSLFLAPPDLEIPLTELSTEKALEKACSLFTVQRSRRLTPTASPPARQLPGASSNCH
jgi:cysteate synthase